MIVSLAKTYKKRQEDMKNLSIYEIALQRILSPQQTNKQEFLSCFLQQVQTEGIYKKLDPEGKIQNHVQYSLDLCSRASK